MCLNSKKHRSFLNLAKKIANKNCINNNKWKFGSVIVSSGRVISIGYNKTHKTHSFQLKTTLKAKCCNKSGFLVDRLHAEVDCIKNIKSNKIKNSIIYISRFDNNPSKPCRICLDLIKRNNIKTIVCRTEKGIEVVKL